MPKVLIDKEEWYVPYVVETNKKGGYPTIEVDAATARRWKKARKDFEKMADEIGQTAREQGVEL